MLFRHFPASLQPGLVQRHRSRSTKLDSPIVRPSQNAAVPTAPTYTGLSSCRECMSTSCMNESSSWSRGLVERRLLLICRILETFTDDVVVPSRVVEAKTLGKKFRRRVRMAGMQAQTMPIGTSMVLQTPILV